MSGLRFSIRELLLVTLVAALLLGWGLQTYLRSWPTARERALMQERLEALRESAHALRANVGRSTGNPSKAYCHPQVEALLAELELCTGRERLRVLSQILDETRTYEGIASQRFEAGAETYDEMLAAKAGRLKAEIALERAKAGRK